MDQVILQKPGEIVLSKSPIPRAEPGEALVRVHRVGICGTDLHAFAGRHPLVQYPRVLGHELGVEVIETPPNDHGIAAGDHCAVEPYLNCGSCVACRNNKPNCCQSLKVLGVHVDGGMRSCIGVPVTKLHRSKQLSLDQLALVETLAVGAHAIERAGLAPSETVAVIGAGPIGLSAIQFALLTGAGVLVVDVKDDRLKFCQRLSEHVITVNPGDRDLSQLLRDANEGDLPNVVVDATGNAGSMQRSFDLVAHGGRLVFVGLVTGAISFSDANFHRRELTVLASRNAIPRTFERVIQQIEAGLIDTTLWITHRMRLTEVPARFPALHEEVGLVKAMIDLPDG